MYSGSPSNAPSSPATAGDTSSGRPWWKAFSSAACRRITDVAGSTVRSTRSTAASRRSSASVSGAPSATGDTHAPSLLGMGISLNSSGRLMNVAMR